MVFIWVSRGGHASKPRCWIQVGKWFVQRILHGFALWHWFCDLSGMRGRGIRSWHFRLSLNCTFHFHCNDRFEIPSWRVICPASVFFFFLFYSQNQLHHRFYPQRSTLWKHIVCKPRWCSSLWHNVISIMIYLLLLLFNHRKRFGT